MSASVMHLVCPACGAVNRVAEEHLHSDPNCGQCKAALMAPQSVTLDDARFDKFIARTQLPVLVDFWADWCGPCKMMAPQFEQAAAQMPQVRFAKVETDANPKASVRSRIRSIPTMVLYRGGQEVARRMGATSAPELLRWLQQQLTTSPHA